jgi:hypothetical protein
MPSIFSGKAAVAEIFGNRIAAFPAEFESNSARHCIQFANEIAVASDGFNGTLLTSLLLLYEYALSVLFSLDHDCHLLVDDCLAAKPTEHDAASAFSDYE